MVLITDHQQTDHRQLQINNYELQKKNSKRLAFQMHFIHLFRLVLINYLKFFIGKETWERVVKC